MYEIQCLNLSSQLYLDEAAIRQKRVGKEHCNLGSIGHTNSRGFFWAPPEAMLQWRAARCYSRAAWSYSNRGSLLR